jgi:ribonuclease BN (tRNA processing enzyme)
MDVVLLPSSVGGGREQFLSTFLINGCVAVDAGSIGLYSTPAEQAHVRHILLTHSHVDHIASLPIFIDNVYQLSPDCVTVHGSLPVLDCLRKDVFNDRVMPDFVRLSEGLPPFLRLATLEAGRPITLSGLRVTPVSVDHVVPTLAFVLEDESAAVAIVTDTRPTEAVWEVLRRTPRLRAVFLEATFPNDQLALASISGHLTTGQFLAEAEKLPPEVLVIAVHIKPRFYSQVAAELRAAALPQVEVGEPGKVYQFGQAVPGRPPAQTVNR